VSASVLIIALLSAPFPTEVPEGEEPLVAVEALHTSFRFDIRYATKDNFAGVAAYPIARCVLRRSVAERMVRAQRWLDEKHPGLRLVFKDCYRPDRVQRILWNAVKGTPKQRYVANPDTGTGSIHSYGAAVDLTLADAEGKELDMGTPYDHLGELAEPRHEERFLRERKLSSAEVERRRILRRALVEIAGMKPIPNEWWHFNAPDALRKKYSRLDVPLEAVP